MTAAAVGRTSRGDRSEREREGCHSVQRERDAGRDAMDVVVNRHPVSTALVSPLVAQQLGGNPQPVPHTHVADMISG